MTGLSWRRMRLRVSWKAIAALSLAVNLFLAGFVGTQLWRWRDAIGLLVVAGSRPIAQGGVARAMIERIAYRLPPADRAVFRERLEPLVPQLVSLQQASAGSLERLRRDIVAEPFDARRMRDDLDRSRQARLALLEPLQEALLDTLPRLSPQGRAALASIRLMPGR